MKIIVSIVLFLCIFLPAFSQESDSIKFASYNKRRLPLFALEEEEWQDPIGTIGMTAINEGGFEYTSKYTTHEDYVTKRCVKRNDTIFVSGIFRDMNKYTKDLDAFIACVDAKTKKVLWFKQEGLGMPTFTQALQDETMDMIVASDTLYLLMHSYAKVNIQKTVTTTKLYHTSGKSIGELQVAFDDGTTPRKIYKNTNSEFYVFRSDDKKFDQGSNAKLGMYLTPTFGGESDVLFYSDLCHIVNGNVVDVIFGKNYIYLLGNYRVINFPKESLQKEKRSLGKGSDGYSQLCNIFYMKVDYKGRIKLVKTYDSEEPYLVKKIYDDGNNIKMDVKKGDYKEMMESSANMKINKTDGAIIE